MKSQLTINTKTKYTESKKYQKHFSLDDRIKIQKIITENRDDNGAMTILLKDIGNIFQNDPSTISKEVKLHRIKKELTTDEEKSIIKHVASQKKIRTDYKKKNKKLKKVVDSIT